VIPAPDNSRERNNIMDKIEPLFAAAATAVGGRNGQTGTSDGLVRFELSVPKVVGLRLRDIDLIGWKSPATDPVDWARVNVNGSSISVGQSWSATGGRILAYEMARRNARHGLVSVCAAGAMAGSFLLTRI
jgi:Thiolase, C-terminal domain